MLQHLRDQSEQLRQKLEHPSEMSEQIREKLQDPDTRLWLCLIGGTAVWSLYLITVYSLTSLSCHWDWFAVSTTSFRLRVVQIVATLIAAGLVVLVGRVALQAWRHTRPQNTVESDETIAARRPMFAFVTFLLNALYLLFVIVSLVPILALASCR